MIESPKIKLTIEEKIMLHLLTFTKFQDHFEVPFGTTQDGIANVLAIQRSHVPRAVKRLIDKGLISENFTHVIGTHRRRKVYFLTPSGVIQAKKLKENIQNVEWVFGNYIDKEQRILKDLIKKTKKNEKKTSPEEKITTDISSGNIYIIKEERPVLTYKIFKRLHQTINKGFIITRIKPENIRRVIEDDSFSIYWLSNVEGQNTIDPTNIARLLSTIKSVLSTEDESLIVLDGFEYLTSINGNDAMVKFIHAVQDLVSNSKAYFLLPVNEKAIDERTLALLSREMEIYIEKIEDIKLQKEKPKEAETLIDYLSTFDIEREPFVHYTSQIVPVKNFFGRSNEIEYIREFINNNTTSKVLMIYGLAGMGKTTLIAKILDEYRTTKNEFYFKIGEWVTLSALMVELASYLAELGRFSLKNYVTNRQVIEIGEVLPIIENDFSESNSLIVIDDFHRSDVEIVRFFSAWLEHMVSNLDYKLIILSRNPVVFYDVRDVEVRKIVMEYTLEGLDKNASFELLKSRGLSEKVYDNLYSVTRGHPLALEFITQPEDIKIRSGNIYKFIYNEIFLKLDKNERELLKEAAVYRYPVESNALLTDEGITTETLNSLIGRNIVREPGKNLFDVHDLVREFFYNDLTPIESRKYHARAAEYYISKMEIGDQKLEICVLEALYHYIASKDYDKAADFLIRYASKLIEGGYVEHLKSSLEKISQYNLKRNTTKILILKGDVYDILGLWDNALQNFELALRVLGVPPDPETSAVLYRKIGKIYYNKSNWLQALKYYKKSAELMLNMNNQSGYASAERGLGLILWKTGNYTQAMEHQKKALEISKKVNDVNLQSALYIELGNVHDELGNFQTAMDFYENGIAIARRELLAHELARGLHNLAEIQSELNMLPDALKNYQLAEEIFRKIGSTRERGWTLFNIAGVYIQKKLIDSAIDYLNAGYDILSKLKDDAGLSSIYRFLGVAYKTKKNFDLAMKYLVEARELAKKLNLPRNLADIDFELGLLHSEMKNLERARTYLDESYNIFCELGAKKYYIQKLYRTFVKNTGSK